MSSWSLRLRQALDSYINVMPKERETETKLFIEIDVRTVFDWMFTIPLETLTKLGKVRE